MCVIMRSDFMALPCTMMKATRPCTLYQEYIMYSVILVSLSKKLYLSLESKFSYFSQFPTVGQSLLFYKLALMEWVGLVKLIPPIPLLARA